MASPTAPVDGFCPVPTPEKLTNLPCLWIDDAPFYRRGNRHLLAILCMNVCLYLLTKCYYLWRNKQRAQRWDAMTESERVDYLASTKDEGNKRLDFRFQH